MKIIITESQLKTTMIKDLLKKLYPELIIDIEIEGKTINIKIKGESAIKKTSELIGNIRNDINNFFSDNYKINITSESEYSVSVEFVKGRKGRYEFTLEKELDNGETFEMDGELIPYGTGRDTEYELEPGQVSDDEYYSEHWEDIDEIVLNKFYEVKNDL